MNNEDTVISQMLIFFLVLVFVVIVSLSSFSIPPKLVNTTEVKPIVTQVTPEYDDDVTPYDLYYWGAMGGLW
jgi:hypothetical protein